MSGWCAFAVFWKFNLFLCVCYNAKGSLPPYIVSRTMCSHYICLFSFVQGSYYTAKADFCCTMNMSVGLNTLSRQNWTPSATLLNSSGGKIERFRRRRCTLTSHMPTCYALNAFTRHQDRAMLESNLSGWRGFAKQLGGRWFWPSTNR